VPRGKLWCNSDEEVPMYPRISAKEAVALFGGQLQ
jgi:hypothetical protein